MDDKKIEIIKREKEDYIDLSRSEAENHYKTETTKEVIKKDRPKNVALNKVADFFESKFFSWIFHYIKSRFGLRHKFQSYELESDKGIYKMEKSSNDGKDEITVTLAADWATDTAESDIIGDLIEDKDPDYTIHMGDTYFVGMKEEMKVNFLDNNCSWHRGSSGSFAMMGNHEMYSRGISYFRDLLPSMGIYDKSKNKYTGQKASYFCMENDHWRIVSLDTGYNSVGIPLLEYIFKPKCEFRKEILKWLKEELRIDEDKRGLIFMTHHQYCTAFEKEDEYVKPAEQLAKLIGRERPVLWIWGHEHRLTFFGKYASEKGIPAYGRCIGNGGMPIEFKHKVLPEMDKKRNLILYDERIYTKIKNIDIGYNGFTILNFKGNELRIEYYDIKDQKIIEEKWTADNQSGKIEQQELKVLTTEKGIVQF
ncbi:MAG: metallophosphoesterase [Ignavibacteria bacterium]